MKTRAIKPILSFAGGRTGLYWINANFGKVNYSDNEIAPAITTRISASGDDYIIEIENEY